jgi:rhodanese-related sulfurtransferase
MIEEVDPRTGRTMVDEGATLLDVRHPDEWAAGHVPDAVFLPLDQLDDRYTELPTDRRIVVICRSGARSARAAEALVGAGYDAVNLAGGMKAWVAEGLACVTDDGSPGTVA